MGRVIIQINTHGSLTSTRFMSKIIGETNTRIIEMLVEPPGTHPLYDDSATCMNACEQCQSKSTKNTNVKTSSQSSFKHELLTGDMKVALQIYPTLASLVKKIQEESRFADLIIIDPALSFQTAPEDLPTKFVREVLSIAECPVLLSPERFERVTDIVFCYDGKPPSAHAIKQFTYLFPEYSDVKVAVLQISHSAQPVLNHLTMPLRYWLEENYASVEFIMLAGNIENELSKYLVDKKNCLAVMGAYGRTALSNWLTDSKADKIIRDSEVALFIAHT